MGNIVPQGYKQTKVGVIPEDWEVVQLGDILTIGSGKDYKHLKNGNIPVYGTGGYMLSVDKYLYDGESLCIGRKGTIDKPMLLNGKFWTVDTLFYTHSYINCIPKFLYSSFLRINWKKFNEASGVPSLSKSTIETIYISLPLLKEQQKIANILTTWDDAISKQDELIKAKEELKKGLMQKLLSGEVRFDGFFEKWKNILLGDISKISTGNSNREDSGLNGQYTFFDRSEDIRTSDIYLFDGEAVIVAGEGQRFLPKFFIGKFDLHQRTYAIMNFKDTSSKFIFYYIYQNSNYFLSQAVGSTVKSLRLPMFKLMPIKLPALQEQQKIAEVLSNADKEIELLKNELQELKEQKKALMQKLLTGEVRVKV